MPLALGTTTIKDVKLGNTQVLQIARGGTIIWTATVEVTLANATQVNVQNLFSAADWSSPKIKRVVIPSGITIGSSSTGTPAMRTGTGWGGQLIIENRGSIQGAGGAAGAPTGGVGGDAFRADAAGVQLLNFNQIFAGGGGGGRGGTGGGGSYSTNYNYREPASGWYYNETTWFWNRTWSSSEPQQYDSFAIYWNTVANPTNSITGVPSTATSHTSGGWTYLRGAQVGSAYYGVHYRHRVARQQTRTNTTNTNGGAGGNGGRGQGYGQSNASGSAGANGGTNAGKGGTGGTGGGWGASGNTGAKGANGNRTSGLAGVAGGLAGYALRNSGNITLTNSGDIRGRT